MRVMVKNNNLINRNLLKIGHGSADIIPKGLWLPNTLPTGQITLFKLTSKIDKVERFVYYFKFIK